MSRNKISIVVLCILMLSLLPACSPAATPTLAPNATLPPPTATPAPTATPDVPKNTPTPNASVVLSKAPDLIPAKDKPAREGMYFEMHPTGNSVVYTLPGMDSVQLASEVAYFKKVTTDIYYPPDYKPGMKLPVVIETHGTEESFAFDKDNPTEISQAKLIAASGLIVVAAQAGREPLINLYHLLDFLAVNADLLGMDIHNIGFWTRIDSGSPMLMALQNKGLALRGNFKAAVMLTPNIQLAIPADFPPGFSIFMVNATIGNEGPEAIDGFVVETRANNISTEYHRLDEPLFFYIDSTDQTSKETLQKALEFLKSKLLN